MKIAFAEPSAPKTGSLIVGVLDDRKLTASAQQIDQQSGGMVTRAMAASKFKGRSDDVLNILAPTGLDLGRIILIGLGKAAALDATAWQNAGGKIVAQLNSVGETAAQVEIDQIDGAKISAADAAAELAYGARLRSYRFDKYRTKEKAEQKPTLKALTIAVDAPGDAKRKFAPLDQVADAVFFTRDIVSEPANIIYPETLADRARELEELGVEIDVLGRKEMRKLGMGALLGVGQGSEHPPRLLVMQWNGAPDAKDQRPIAFVGKGVTFDTGGISIKPAGGMEDMKWDMAGAGVVIGLIRALAGRKAKVNAVGIGGLVENMPSGTAQRPGDIVTSMSGQTIEVLNTDAEGRLVLADALWYCQDHFKPRFMIDLATLTGAIIVALGSEYAGMYASDDKLAKQLVAAGDAVGEKLWRMPLHDNYDRMMDSDAADVKNISGGRDAGSITAAQFLKRFTNGVPWAHLDIAGTTWSKKDAATVPKGATSFGVRLLNKLIEDNYEE
jgi:leucyl aminopeptidase